MKTKLTKVEEVRTPREINDMPYGAAQTKARREFLAAVVAEKEAAGFTAKIVGKGSYQTVAVYRAEQIETREQLRGTCQRCAGSVAVVNGVLAHHGYTRPGWGSIVGDCIGVNRKPAEHSIDFAKDLRTSTLEHAAKMETRAAEIEAGDKIAERPEVTEARAKVAAAKALPATSDRVKAINAAQRELNGYLYLPSSLRADARSARDYAAMLERDVFPRLGKDLAIVLIPVEGR